MTTSEEMIFKFDSDIDLNTNDLQSSYSKELKVNAAATATVESTKIQPHKVNKNPTTICNHHSPFNSKVQKFDLIQIVILLIKEDSSGGFSISSDILVFRPVVDKILLEE
eukprot:GDKJ01022920.1.p2 GENE.GDKJ01022920.1~~GDKJ01022920.1.p2  ORF type:complete len:110 (+),score=18.38 GDKJ01022920.1:384-713(+)